VSFSAGNIEWERKYFGNSAQKCLRSLLIGFRIAVGHQFLMIRNKPYHHWVKKRYTTW